MGRVPMMQKATKAPNKIILDSHMLCSFLACALASRTSLMTSARMILRRVELSFCERQSRVVLTVWVGIGDCAMLLVLRECLMLGICGGVGGMTAKE